MKARFITASVIAATLVMPFCMTEAVAQVGTPGTRQMRDVQRKAEQKARNNQSVNQSASQSAQNKTQQQTQSQSQHHEASAAKPASSP